MHLELVEFLPPVLILSAKIVDLALVVTHSHQQLAVGLLPGEELVYDLLNIGQAG